MHTAQVYIGTFGDWYQVWFMGLSRVLLIFFKRNSNDGIGR